jgi:hypothetical protein
MRYEFYLRHCRETKIRTVGDGLVEDVVDPTTLLTQQMRYEFYLRHCRETKIRTGWRWTG